MKLRVQVLAHDDRVRQAARALPAERFDVSYSTDPDAAFSVLRNKGCDLAVVELEVGGFGFVRDLRAAPLTNQARVVMLCNRPHDRWLCLQAGADEVLIKPLQDVTTLISAIDLVLQTAKTANQS